MTTTARLAAASTAVALLLTLGACATPRDEANHPAGTPLGAAAGGPDLPVPSCSEGNTVEADPAFYREEPRYHQPLDLLDAASAWAGQQPGFEQPWLDHEHHGWIHLGFSGDVDIATLQDAVEREFPGEGIVAVALPHAQRELDALADRVRGALRDAGATWGASSADAAFGRVSIDSLAPDQAAFDVLGQFADEPLCVFMLPADSFVPEGEQPTAGEGWRLLGHERGVGHPYRTGVATDEAQLTSLWDESGLSGAPGEIDWQREIVVWFGAVYGSTCPVRLDGVLMTGSALHGEIVVPGWPGACTEDANSHSFVVAVERALLPAGPFHVQLGPEDPPSGIPEERTLVDADLSAPGSRADIDAMQPATAPEPGTVTDGHDSMPLAGSAYVWQPRPECAGVVIGPIDASLWRLDEGSASLSEWLEEPGAMLWLHPINEDQIVAVSEQMDYLFVRTDSPCSPPS